MKFQDRTEAGKKLAEKLKNYNDSKDAIVIGLPRGGVITASQIAIKLHLPLDIIVPRKIGAPFSEELAIGAITEDGEAILNDELINNLEIQSDYIEQQTKKEIVEAARRIKKYRDNKPSLDLTNKIAILVDDGIATGFTMLAAINSAKAKNAKKIIVASPVIARDTLTQLKNKADDIIYLHIPLYFGAVGEFYKTFDQTTDEEVIDILK